MLGGQTTMSSSMVFDNTATGGGHDLAVGIGSDPQETNTMLLTDLILPPYSNHPKSYIGSNQDIVKDIIEGSIMYQSSHLEIGSISGKESIGRNPAPNQSPPEKTPNYAGNLDLGKYCQKTYTQNYQSSDATNPFQLACIDTKGTKHPVDPLQACQEQYLDKNIATDRLVDYFDPASWQCYTNAISLGHANMADHVAAFCQSNNMNIANNPRTTAYDWKCLHQGGTIGHYPIHLDNFLVGLNVADLCKFVHKNEIAPTSTVMERLVNYNDPGGWECWELQTPPTA